jgi:DNA-binding HxlR family transcriptional regulator
MAIKTSQDWHGCPIRYGAAVLGDPWNLVILRDMMFKGARRYSDLLNAGEGMATNILADRLARLEAEGIVTRAPGRGARRIYALTEKGLGLVPVLIEIIHWSERWDADTEVPAGFSRDLRAGRPALAARIAGELRSDARPPKPSA